jgi:FMN phosphatase YigB (HAD superfamily)
MESFMVLEVKWCGFDYGECIMKPDDVRNVIFFGDVYRELGKPELIPEKIEKYRVLKEKYGGYPVLYEGHRDEIYGYVLDNESDAIALFERMELELKAMGEGLEDALLFLQSEGIEVYVVSEMKKSPRPLGSDPITRFLTKQGILKYFKGLITPIGKIDYSNGHVDSKYVGFTKGEGTIYDIIARDLKDQGIQTCEAVMIGDRPSTDIDPAHGRGFKTIQYTGFTDSGRSKADFVVGSFLELKKLLRKKVS